MIGPRGYAVRPAAGGTLLAAEARLEACLGAGLERRQGWEAALDRGTRGAGRGVTVVVDLAGRPARLKQLRRGGLLAPLWRERFVGTRRLLANLTLPLEARRRGLATPEPLALLVVPGPPGLARGWLAVEEIAHARDLAAVLATRPEGDPASLAAALDMVRVMHDAGIEHPDLNLGNVLVRVEPGKPARAWILDLDAARLHPGPLGSDRRLAALRRMERSHLKLFGTDGTRGARVRAELYRCYAADDAALAERFASRR